MSEQDVMMVLLVGDLLAGAFWAGIWADLAREWVSTSLGWRGRERRRRLRLAWLAPVWLIPAAFFVGRAIWRAFSEAWLTRDGE